MLLKRVCFRPLAGNGLGKLQLSPWFLLLMKVSVPLRGMG